jgi:hypothetical protein
MPEWNYEEYLNGQIKKIKKFQEKGCTDREILNKGIFCYEALQACGLPLSYLVPGIEGKEMDFDEWDCHTSSEHKWEYCNGVPFGNPNERDRVLIGLLYSAGLEHLLEILPEETLKELINLIKDKYKDL